MFAINSKKNVFRLILNKNPSITRPSPHMLIARFNTTGSLSRQGNITSPLKLCHNSVVAYNLLLIIENEGWIKSKE